MKNKKLLAFLLAFALIFTQFSLLSVVSAEIAPLTGRAGFLKGVTIQTAKTGTGKYTKPYKAIREAKALGVNMIRTRIKTDENGYSYDVGMAELAIANGMQVMAVTSLPYLHSDNSLIAADEIDIAGITATYTEIAEALEGKVAYYQIGNEMNQYAVLSGMRNGMQASDFQNVDGIAVAAYAANKAIKEADPSAQTVINFSWQHAGFIDALKAVDIDADTGEVATGSTTHVTHLSWDVIGLDWYADDVNSSFTINGSPIDYDDVIGTINTRYPDMPVIVCEADIRPVSENQDGTIEYIGQPSWIADFANYCYNNNKVIGFFVFELYDEPGFSYDENNVYSFNRESHHGLIDNDGNRKPTYDVVRSLFGGTGVVTVNTVTAPAMNNEGELKAVFQSGMVEASFPRLYSELEVLSVENQAGVNFRNGRFIEFDYYVEDYDAYMAAMDRMEMNLDLIVRTDGVDVSRNCRFVPNDYIVADGWNHIKIARSAFFERDSTSLDVDWSNINQVVLKFNAHELENYSELAGMKLAIANVCSTDVSVPANQVEQYKVVIDETGYEGPSERKTGYFSLDRTLSSSVDLSFCQKIEMDLYVENTAFFDEITASFPLHLRLISDTSGAQHCRYNLSTYVTHAGWNHIQIDISDYFNKTSGFNFSSVKRYRIYFNGTSGTTMPYPTTYIMFKNFNGVEPVMPATPDNIVGGTAGKVIKTYQGNTSNLKKITKLLDEPMDLSGADYIEFDIYVENVAHFWQYQKKWLGSTSGNHTFVFYLSPSDRDPTPSTVDRTYIQSAANKQVFCHFVDIADQITVDGWNHVKVPVTQMRTGAGDSNFGTYLSDVSDYRSLLTGIRRVGWFNSRQTATTSEAYYPDERIGFANVFGTAEEYNISPALPENVIVSAPERVTGIYDDHFSALTDIQATFANALNLSIAEDIEFDLYVEDVDHFFDYQSEYLSSVSDQFRFYLATGNGDQITCAFSNAVLSEQITEDGWNHIAIPKSDWGVNGNDAATPDFSNIVGAGLYTAKTGAYAGEYTEEHIGFANVCGTADLTAPTDVMSDKTDFVGAALTPVTFDSEGIYAVELEEVLDVSDSRMMELDVFVTDDGFTALDVEFASGNGGYAVYSFEDLVPGWNHLAIRLSDAVEEDSIDFTDITGYALYGDARESVILTNFYTADYVDGDGNRDGFVDVLDLIRMKKYSAGSHTGNMVAMDVSGGDYVIDALDLSALTGYLLTDSWG